MCVNGDDELALVEQVIRGEPQAFAAIVQRYQRPIFAFVVNMLPRSLAAEAEDIAQDVFLAAYSNLPSFDATKGALSTWLFVIARRRVLNLLHKRRPASGLDAHLLEQRVDVAAGMERWEQMAALDRALATLPDEQRAAFVLAEIQELDLSQVAQIENVPLGTVKSRLSRAKAALRAAMGDVHGVER